MQGHQALGREDEPRRGSHTLELQLDAFAWSAIEQEATDQGVPVTELARFAVLYYLADVDSGRVARKIPRAERSPRHGS